MLQHLLVRGWIVALCLMCGGGGAAADDGPALERARELQRLLVAGRFDEFAAAGDERMRAAMDAGATAQAWQRVEFQLGKYAGEESAAATKVGELRSVRLVSRFARGRLTMRVVLDDALRVSGLWFDRIEPADNYRAPDYVDREKFTEEGVTVSAGTCALSGTLSLPKTGARVPGVVLVHGSGPHDQDETIGPNKPFRDLAWGLATRGAAVLRYEKRTLAHPTALKAEEWTLEDEVIEDALAAIALLRERPEVDPREVFVLGHSLGGFAAPLIAQRDGKLAGIISLAGTPRSLIDLVIEQTTYLAGLDGKVTEAEQAAIDKIKAAAEAIRAGRLDEAPEVAGMPARYMADMERHRPLEVAQQLGLRMLFLQGGRDYQVPRTELDVWRKGFVGRPRATFKLYPDLNHLFMAGRGPSTPMEYQRSGHVDVRMIDDVAAWIGAVAR